MINTKGIIESLVEDILVEIIQKYASVAVTQFFFSIVCCQE